jgi:hypothetical protein
MKCLRQARGWLVFAAVASLAALPLFGGTTTNAPSLAKPASDSTNAIPPRQTAPVEYFRALLAMAPDERERQLVIYPPPIRERLVAKIQEYEELDPDERELRLRATELRWYLLPLLREPPADRAAQLAQVPDDLRDLVNSRLSQWSILPPQLQQEFLDNERALRYFTHVDSTNGPSATGDWEYTPPDSDLARWKALSENQRKQIAASVNQFFELTPEEKQETLNTLSDAEREQMGNTLQAFDNLSAEQRAECIRAFAKFASMNAAEKQEFLKNAERWSQMSPQERQTWRDLVANVPNWPPLPQSAEQPEPGPAVATNHN